MLKHFQCWKAPYRLPLFLITSLMPHFIDEESEIQTGEDLWDGCRTKAPGSCPFAVLAPIFPT